MNARGIPTAAYQVLLGGVPPRRGTPPSARSDGGTRGGVPPIWTWLGYPPPQLDLAWVPPPPAGPGRGTPPPGVDRQTDACQNIAFPHTTYAAGN